MKCSCNLSVHVLGELERGRSSGWKEEKQSQRWGRTQGVLLKIFSQCLAERIIESYKWQVVNMRVGSIN